MTRVSALRGEVLHEGESQTSGHAALSDLISSSALHAIPGASACFRLATRNSLSANRTEHSSRELRLITSEDFVKLQSLVRHCFVTAQVANASRCRMCIYTCSLCVLILLLFGVRLARVCIIHLRNFLDH